MPVAIAGGIDNALRVEGWMDAFELEWLAFEAQRHQVIVEIGSYLGRSSRALGDNCSGTVYCVDHWNGPKELDPPYARSLLYEMFCHNVSDLIESKKIIPVKLDSLEAASNWDFPQPDMVFIDGSHDLESVRQDMLAWAKVIKPGGLFCGHDAHWPGVFEARRLLLPRDMTGVGSIWAVDNFMGLK